MESLKINKFLTIKDAHIEVGDFTVLIGPQASGKSVIAKLLYFFRQFINEQLVQSIATRGTKKALQLRGMSNFEELFPKYTWEDTEFLIVYKNQDVTLSVQNKSSGRKCSFSFEYSANLDDLYKRAKLEYRKLITSLKRNEEEIDESYVSFAAINKILNDLIHTSDIGYCFERSVFIPASRSFFTNLQNNVFSFLANNIVIDPLIKEFGSVYELSKSRYSRPPLSKKDSAGGFHIKVKNEIENILIGKYIYSKGQDWIEHDGKRININNASSGQQESLPMLIVLHNRTLQYNSRVRPTIFFIEEPESHLFPRSQKNLIELFALLHQARGHKFFITSHSPYILAALNNLVTASDIVKKKGESVRDKVIEIVGSEGFVEFKDIRAYTFKDGYIEDVTNSENNLIGASIIDEVSDDFDRVFDGLMELDIW